MMHHNDIEKEVDAIRDKVYLTIKNMTSSERVEYINSRARAIMKKHGIDESIAFANKGSSATPAPIDSF